MHDHLLELFKTFKGRTPPDSALDKFDAGASVVKEQYKVFIDVCKPEIPKDETENRKGARQPSSDLPKMAERKIGMFLWLFIACMNKNGLS